MSCGCSRRSRSPAFRAAPRYSRCCSSDHRGRQNRGDRPQGSQRRRAVGTFIRLAWCARARARPSGPRTRRSSTARARRFHGARSRRPSARAPWPAAETDRRRAAARGRQLAWLPFGSTGVRKSSRACRRAAGAGRPAPASEARGAGRFYRDEAAVPALASRPCGRSARGGDVHLRAAAFSGGGEAAGRIERWKGDGCAGRAGGQARPTPPLSPCSIQISGEKAPASRRPDAMVRISRKTATIAPTHAAALGGQRRLPADWLIDLGVPAPNQHARGDCGGVADASAIASTAHCRRQRNGRA